MKKLITKINLFKRIRRKKIDRNIIILMSFDPKYFGLKKDYLYEVIVSSYSILNDGMTIKPNAACMGIRLEENDKIQITPFYSTTTYQNLKNNGIVTLNFIDDLYLYALAALKEPNSPIGLIEVPSKYYEFKHLESLSMDVPYIKNSWGILTCKVFKEFQEIKKDSIKEMKIPVFSLKVISSELLKTSHKLLNRSENLALEVIILATRLKVAKDNENESLFSNILDKIQNYVKDINRFGKNKEALRTVELVNNYISKLMN